MVLSRNLGGAPRRSVAGRLRAPGQRARGRYLSSLLDGFVVLWKELTGEGVVGFVDQRHFMLDMGMEGPDEMIVPIMPKIKGGGKVDSAILSSEWVCRHQ